MDIEHLKDLLSKGEEEKSCEYIDQHSDTIAKWGCDVYPFLYKCDASVSLKLQAKGLEVPVSNKPKILEALHTLVHPVESNYAKHFFQVIVLLFMLCTPVSSQCSNDIKYNRIDVSATCLF